jgi:chemosensory pili system protein ChpA (sensor histidine kinase/response regulator)
MDTKALILVVDDNRECLDILTWTLQRQGFRTVAATCGADAVELAIGLQPRMVLMDLSMPNMDGYEATQAIRAHPRSRNIPVIAISSYCDDPGYARRSLKEGFVACLGKLWDEEALVRVVTEVMADGVLPQRSTAHTHKKRKRAA